MKFILRAISTILLLTVFLLAFLLKNSVGTAIFYCISIFISVASILELSEIMQKYSLRVFRLETILTALILYTLILIAHPVPFIDSTMVIAVFGSYCLLRVLLCQGNAEIVNRSLVSMGIIILFVLPLTYLARIYALKSSDGRAFGVDLVAYMVLVTKFGDIGAYIVGTLTSKLPRGNTKFLPKISPKKSLEGTFGGLVFSVATSVLLRDALELQPWISVPAAIIYGGLLFIGGFVGDLCESALKRGAGVKDSGIVLPGIGGVLDLIDSLLLNSPMFYILLCFASDIHNS